MQKLRRIRAALSDSLSSDYSGRVRVLPQVSRSSKDMLTAGQNASAPSLLESLLTGPPTFWNQLLLADLVLSHMDDLDGCWEAMAALAVCLGDRVGGVI